ncbi:hypothetical protein A2303_01270 [Candidatus Falkowbacteria bacterium RIFOXYB2_FULL_47_14]|uniref:Uncharacterized protein n=1 Tax=Candidatus Falkowbacteria bacterium RIFOXYA2_FULL_47_19 TaxID=1797994 RepID=A0A1F5SI36_9BACT|nr:MAG: hypothetical protein A2227_05565 [Candidatus Falkowbacteria bacterium RIFOXYA2_FULL_47_19]OGF34482.1 MAG: hypothetical protein A2468_04610 [Candidatus Falkowbacteria bacterium RIFOXYC2_FULL_46_15]OGF43521.1 MAG: hypothetical protein A2303_01270 [Candidatus Falkowbacteria bacterium RIFOXYB2_FULL_47_14]
MKKNKTFRPLKQNFNPDQGYFFNCYPNITSFFFGKLTKPKICYDTKQNNLQPINKIYFKEL